MHNLAAHISWSKAAETIGLPYRNDPLPVLSHCPACGLLCTTIRHDNRFGGAWFCCSNEECGACGDMLEMGGLSWGCKPTAALLRFAELGVGVPEQALVPEALARYTEEFTERRRRLRMLWDRARERLTMGDAWTANQLRWKLGIHSSMDKYRWKARPGRLLGALPAWEIEHCFCPESVAQHGRDRRTPFNPSARRVFRGRGWDEVLVFAYEDLPGRLCGFFFVGRDGTVFDRIYRPALGQRSELSRGQRPEAGLAGLETVERSHHLFGHHVVAVSDPLLALKLQIRHASAFFQPLPLVTWHDGPTALTRESWEVLSDKTVVIWGPGLTPKLLHQAMAADGLISLLGPSDVTSTALGKHYLRLAPAHMLLYKVIRHARPWREALRHWAKTKPDGQVLDLLSGLKFYGISIEDLAPFCGGSRRARRLLPPAPPTRTVTVGGVTVRERPDGWFVVRGSRPEAKLCNAIVRLDELVDGKNGHPRYRGRFLYRDREIPFDVAARWLSRSPVGCLRTLALSKGAPFHWHRGFRVPLLDVALAFQPLRNDGVVLEEIQCDRSRHRSRLILLPADKTTDTDAAPERTQQLAM